MVDGLARRHARGEIERLPSGSLRVRLYAGLEPVSKRGGTFSRRFRWTHR